MPPAVRLRVRALGRGDRGGAITGAEAALQGERRERPGALRRGGDAEDPEVIKTLLEAFGRSWKGTTPGDFEAQVRQWLNTAKQPKLGVGFVELVYKPMLELLDYLRANQFREFVVSGGGRDFMRVFAEETWGIYKENMIGTAAEYSFSDGRIIRLGEHAPGDLERRPRQARAHLRPDRPPAGFCRGQRGRRYRDVERRQVFSDRQP